MKQNSSDFENAELTDSIERKETNVTLTEVKDDFAHDGFEQNSKLLAENKMQNTQEASLRTISVQKCKDFEKIRTNEGNTEQNKEVTAGAHLPKQFNTDESVDNKETDQLYMLSKVLQSESNKENVECAECDFWDFAGQKDFYATHQTFLTMNAIYLLTIDLSSFETAQPVQKEGGKLDDIGGKHKQFSNIKYYSAFRFCYQNRSLY